MVRFEHLAHFLEQHKRRKTYLTVLKSVDLVLQIYCLQKSKNHREIFLSFIATQRKYQFSIQKTKKQMKNRKNIRKSVIFLSNILAI